MTGGARVARSRARTDVRRGRALAGGAGAGAPARAAAVRRRLRDGGLLAFAGVALVPLVMLAVAPVVLGVPHVAADLRYLRRAASGRSRGAPGRRLPSRR